MSLVQEGRISFTEAEYKAAKGACANCSLNAICGGLDSKILGADIHPTLLIKPTDTEIDKQAACLKKINI